MNSVDITDKLQALFSIIFHGILNTWSMMANIKFFNTDLLRYCVALVVICTAIKVILTTQRSGGNTNVKKSKSNNSKSNNDDN